MEAANLSFGITTEFMMQDDWEDIMEANYLEDQHSIDGYMLQAYTAWEAGGKYYEAGNLTGLVSTYLYDMDGTSPSPSPSPPSPWWTKYPGNAARDYYSGEIFGFTGLDVKAEMDTCFPDD